MTTCTPGSEARGGETGRRKRQHGAPPRPLLYPSSYGYRPGRRAQDAIVEIHHFTSRPSSYEWVIEGDITACFDNVDHHLLMELVAERIADRKALRLVRDFLRAGVVERHGGFAETLTGTPQGGVATPPTHWATSSSMSR
jgi:retron-type reverse transcriptase